LIRVPAGAALAAGVFGGDHASWTLVAALMGGALAATSHVAKATTRAAVNSSPEPFSNIALSLFGDAAVPAMLWMSWAHPMAFFAALALALVVMIGLTLVLLRFLKALWRRLRGSVVAAGHDPPSESLRP
jgi:TRAP-type C4-dicarboxylate transport system permease small subunit